MSEISMGMIMDEIRAMRTELSEFKAETRHNFSRLQTQIDDQGRQIYQINGRLLTMESDIGSIKKDIWEIKDDLRKIKKFVSTENADFPNS